MTAGAEPIDLSTPSLWTLAQALADTIKGRPDPAVTLPSGASAFERIAAILAEDRTRSMEKLDDDKKARIRGWHYLARAAQWPPDGDWRTWLILAGRGFGKTRAGAEWVRMQAETCRGIRIALVAGSSIARRRG